MFKRARSLQPDEVASLSPEKDADKLRQLLKEGTPTVQAAALSKLGDVGSATEHWLQNRKGEAVPAELLTAAEAVLHKQTAEALTQSLSNAPVVDQYALLCQCQPNAAIIWLSEQPEAVCLDLALHADRAADRQQAADRLSDPTSLQAVQRAAKGHDNALYRIAKTRLQQIRAEKAKDEERQAAVAQVKASLEKLARVSSDPLLEGKFLHLQRRIETLQLTPEERAEIDPLLSRVNAHLVEIEADKRAHALAREAADAPADLAPVDQPTESEADQAEGTESSDQLNGAAAAENGEAIPPSASEPVPEPKEPALSAEEQAAKDERLAAERARETEDRRNAHEVRSLLRRGQGALKGGHLRQARGIWRTIDKQMADLNPNHHKGLMDETEQYHQAMEKLADWQDFAVLPKKEELMEHMRLLAERSMHPQDKADAVQALQKEWQTLSQGGGGKHQDMWEEFHKLAEKAYAPCKDYFAEQAELQAVNATKRRELIEQLHLYLDNNDWHDPDWAEVEKVLRLAAREWRHFSPVKAREHRATEKAYHAVVTQIREQLNKEYDRNKDIRERIIADAEALRDEDNVRAATEQLKALQQAWKEAGRTHRKDDQRLWQAFRSICDELFARRDEQSQAFKTELDQHQSQANRIITRIETAAASPDPQAHADALAQLPEWEREFEACNPLPKARIADTQQRFSQAVASLRGAKQQQQQQQQRLMWHALFERVKCLGELEVAMHSGAFDAELQKQVAAAWEDGTALPPVASSIDSRLKATFAAFTESKSPAATLSAAEYRRQVILLEVLVGAESPAEDRELRLQVQVERLADGMGQQIDRAFVERLLAEWLKCAATMPEDDYLALHARVENACLEYFIK